MKFKYLFALLVVSCNDHYDNCEGKYYIQTAIPANDRLVIHRAAKQLNEWIGEERIHLIDHKALDYCPIKNGTNEAGALGHQKDDGYIRIDLHLLDRLEDEPCKSHLLLLTSMHEMMHGLNMHHVDDLGSVLYPAIDCNSHFTDTDRNECRRVNVCK